MSEQSSPVAGSEGASIEGVYSINRVTYYNEETHYGVVHLVPADGPGAVGFAAVGTCRSRHRPSYARPRAALPPSSATWRAPASRG